LQALKQHTSIDEEETLEKEVRWHISNHRFNTGSILASCMLMHYSPVQASRIEQEAKAAAKQKVVEVVGF
jgi:hypothetical protein